ncbi:MAG: Holliday junction branch migration protein RuvA [Rhodospirillaceae bacterium]|nr:Holliday junction branch migration protein RuvA [Rhodospirillaceae bacterium]MBT7511409.1 Holliday junction branch migration protein RuvA [Rhodospirillaceae bacterium]
MIARLKGLIDAVGDDWAIVDVSGVGYIVFCSVRTLSRLAVGEAAVLEIETHVREDHIHLYGFAGAGERDWFRLLTTVQGVGAKVALGILGVLSPDELLQGIAAADKGAFTRAPGVGPKLATRLVTELKDKAGALALGASAVKPVGATAAPAPDAVASSSLSDAASALVNLGYGPSDALGAASRAASQLGEGAGVEDLIRIALQELAPVETRTGGRS